MFEEKKKNQEEAWKDLEYTGDNLRGARAKRWR
jgi:sarcosine oxidase delta subunit